MNKCDVTDVTGRDWSQSRHSHVSSHVRQKQQVKTSCVKLYQSRHVYTRAREANSHHTCTPISQQKEDHP